METKKFAIAVFVGIFVGAIIALVLRIPLLLRGLLGVLVGTSVAFLCYDLKEVQKKAPLAWRATVRKGSNIVVRLKKPHPFLWSVLLVSTLGALFVLSLLLKSADVTLLLLFPSTTGLYFAWTFYWILLALTEIGSTKHKFGKNCYWEKDKLGKKQGKGDTHIEFTYRNIYGLTLRGLWICIYFVLWEMWILGPRFLKNLLILINSHERVLCAIYCAVGVTVIHILFGHQTLLLGQKIIIAVSGGIIGAAVGAIQYRLVQLFLAPATNNA